MFHVIHANTELERIISTTAIVYTRFVSLSVLDIVVSLNMVRYGEKSVVEWIAELMVYTLIAHIAVHMMRLSRPYNPATSPDLSFR
jgi:hypothetical protein